MLSCISFHYYSIASDELAVISTSGCCCFLRNKHLLIPTGQTIYGKVHKSLPDKIQRKYVSAVTVWGTGQSSISFTHHQCNLNKFLLISPIFVLISPNIFKSIYLIRDIFSTYTEFSYVLLEKKNPNKHKQLKITITQILSRFIVFRETYKAGLPFVHICMGNTCFSHLHSTSTCTTPHQSKFTSE